MSKRTRINQRKRPVVVQQAAPTKAIVINHAVQAEALRVTAKEVPQIKQYIPPKSVVPAEKLQSALAMDSTDYAYVNTCYGGQHFQGYPYLAMLAQRPEFRKMSETIAREMTRAWIDVICTGGEDKSERIQQIEAALVKYKVQDCFRKMAEYDGLYGRGQIYIDVKTPNNIVARDDNEELKTALIIDKAKIKQGSLIGFTPIEPVWTYPGAYNADKPLDPNYYRPTLWYVMGQTVHASRLLTFISREVPDILKAAYNFGGLSLSQMAEPYVDNWIRTRNSIGDMVHSFSISCFSTNMSGTLSGEANTGIFQRIDLFNRIRDNRGAMVLDKESEEFFQVNTPLSGLHELQAQAQEQMASVSSIPLVFLLGITPQGLNASSEGEILVFETTIHAMQELIFSAHLKTVIDIIQLNEFGEIDPDITFKFNPLREQTPKEQAENRKADADADVVLVGAGIITPDESRARLAADPDSPYHGLELNGDIPEDDDMDDDNA